MAGRAEETGDYQQDKVLKICGVQKNHPFGPAGGYEIAEPGAASGRSAHMHYSVRSRVNLALSAAANARSQPDPKVLASGIEDSRNQEKDCRNSGGLNIDVNRQN